MKKSIFFGILFLSFSILVISWTKNKAKSNEKYSQANVSSYAITKDDFSRMRNHFTEVTEGKFVTTKAWLSVKEMKSMISNLDDNANIEIYFGAFQEVDLPRLKKTGDLYYMDKKDSRTVIFKVPSETGKDYVRYNVVQICPPPPGCAPDDPK